MAKRKAKQNDESKSKDIINDNTIVECEVLISFKDKYTKETYKKGKIIKITFERCMEIVEKNPSLIKLIER